MATAFSERGVVKMPFTAQEIAASRRDGQNETVLYTTLTENSLKGGTLVVFDFVLGCYIVRDFGGDGAKAEKRYTEAVGISFTSSKEDDENDTNGSENPYQDTIVELPNPALVMGLFAVVR